MLAGAGENYLRLLFLQPLSPRAKGAPISFGEEADEGLYGCPSICNHISLPLKLIDFRFIQDSSSAVLTTASTTSPANRFCLTRRAALCDVWINTSKARSDYKRDSRN